MSILQRHPGTYLLFLTLYSHAEIQIGRSKSGKMTFFPGYYFYVGSALGPGGLGSRLQRHASDTVRKHWHIDYFTEKAKLIGAFVIENEKRLECKMAKNIERLTEVCYEGFGASDCACKGHLFFIGTSLDESLFIKEVEEKLTAQYLSREVLA